MLFSNERQQRSTRGDSGINNTKHGRGDVTVVVSSPSVRWLRCGRERDARAAIRCALLANVVPLVSRSASRSPLAAAVLAMNVNWTNDLIFRLIELYRERRLLWDRDMADYRDKAKKHRTWQDIADIMNINKDIVMRKMKILTTQFQREYAKSGHLPPEEGSKWFAYSRLSFLGGNAASRTPAVVTRRPAFEHCRVSPVAVDETCTSIEVKEEAEMSEGGGESLGSSASASCRKRRGTRSRDEYAVYGEYVALKLRNLTDPYTRHKAQQQINDVLFHAHMEHLSH